MTDVIFRQWAQEFREHLRRREYDATSPPPEETHMAFPLITSIENELHNAGHEVSDILHGVLSRHLTVGNVLAHAGQWAQVAEASPILQTVERYALGPAGEAAVAKVVEDVAGLLAAQAPVTPNLQAGAEPEPAPAA